MRYKQTFVGAAWALFQPLSLMIAFTIVFSVFIGIDTGEIPYPIFAYTALLPWTFFSASISFGSQSLVNNLNLVTKIYFPREVLPIASIFAALLDFLIGALVLLGLMIWFRIDFRLSWFLIPAILCVQLLFTFGIVIFTSALNVFYRDIRFVVPIFLQLWMYATPVIYPVSIVPDSLRYIYWLNPMVGIIEGYRALMFGPSDIIIAPLAWSFLVAVVTSLLAYRWFKRKERELADRI